MREGKMKTEPKMKTEQCNLRVLPQHKSLMKETANRLKTDPFFERDLNKLLNSAHQTPPVLKADPAPVADRLSLIEPTPEKQAPRPPERAINRIIVVRRRIPINDTLRP